MVADPQVHPISAPRFLHLPRAQAVCSLPRPPRQLGPRLPPSPARARCGELEARDLQLLAYGFDVLQRVSRRECFDPNGMQRNQKPRVRILREVRKQAVLTTKWSFWDLTASLIRASDLTCRKDTGLRLLPPWETVVRGLKILEQGTSQGITETILFATTTQFSVLAVCDVLPALSNSILLTALEGGHRF